MRQLFDLQETRSKLDEAMELVEHDRFVLGGLRDGMLKVIADSNAPAGRRNKRTRELAPLARRALFERQGVGGFPLGGGVGRVRRLRDFADRIQRATPAQADDTALLRRIGEVRAAYREALDDDLNLPQGVGLVFELLREANSGLDYGRVGERSRSELLALIGDVDAHLDVIRADEPGLADEVERLIADREAARAARDFGRADQIRDELRQRGIALEDSKEGVRWKRVQAAAD